jgi:protein ImuB
MRWLALHLPLLPLEAFCATLPAADAARAVALVKDHALVQVNRAAAERGLKPGMKRATAMALAAELLLAESHPPREAAALQAVAHAALAFTPAVTLQGHTVLLEVQGSLRLFGGAAALQRRLLDAVAPLGHRVTLAAAPTARGAALLAHWHPARHRGQPLDLPGGAHATQLAALRALLDDAPVWLLGPGREHWDALQGMGLQRLADLRALPRAGLARRFGEGLLTELDQALGLVPDPRRWVQLPPVFSSRAELFMRAETTAQVLHGAQVLLARLVAWAQARQARVRAFTLTMLHERSRRPGQPAHTELRIELAQPALDAAHLHGLLAERLARLVLAAPTGELLLHCHETVRAPAPNGELFPTRASTDEGLTRLLEQLCARLGEPQVQRLQPLADHRPEQASRAVPVLQPPAADEAAAWPALQALAGSALPIARPAWRLPEPLPLAERDALPLLQGRPLQLLAGPERIEGGWWGGEPGAAVARDYFIAMDEQGALLWLYRSRLAPDAPLLPTPAAAPTWYLHGRFA